MLFIHGGGVTHAFWEHQVTALAEQFRTITFDLRGGGASDRPASGYSVDAWTEDARTLIDCPQLGRPVVVGHALGAHIALRLAATHADAIERLVLCSAAPWFVGDREQTGGFSNEFWQQMRAAWMTNRPQSELDLADRHYFHEDPSEGMRMACLHMALTGPLPVYLELTKTLPQVDHRGALPGVDLAVLLLHGRHDRKNRYEGAYLAEHLPNARLVPFEESAHCPPLEEPQRFSEALLNFLLEDSPERVRTSGSQ